MNQQQPSQHAHIAQRHPSLRKDYCPLHAESYKNISAFSQRGQAFYSLLCTAGAPIITKRIRNQIQKRSSRAWILLLTVLQAASKQHCYVCFKMVCMQRYPVIKKIKCISVSSLQPSCFSGCTLSAWLLNHRPFLYSH